MSSHAERHGHLDATAGREVVYCHACANEWYRDEGGLTCPECRGEITEIIDPENDPRDLGHHSSASTSPELHPYDSDPDEADIDEHTNQGFVFRRNIREGPGHHHHHDPAYAPTIESFVNMLNQFGARAPDGRSFSHGPGEHGEHQGHGEHERQGHEGQAGEGEHAHPNFARDSRLSNIFSDILRDTGPPPGHEHVGEDGMGGGHPPGFGRGLQDLLNLLTPGNAVHGDAVYSQEALDRIITRLMEANPQSNAAPPATDEALRNLERKPVNKQMLGSEVVATSLKDQLQDLALIGPTLSQHTCPMHTTLTGSHSTGLLSLTATRARHNTHDLLVRARAALTKSCEISRHSEKRETESMAASETVPQHLGIVMTPLDCNVAALIPPQVLARERAPSEHGARMRQRSPSQSSRRSTADSDQQSRTSGHGPISWLRGQFSRGPGTGSPRDGSRQ
ncbi:hypothetical protein NXS19_002473 [Fusarium pseudograminearum]|nr:hypothetical protein NXS19_002473 [Fusarium pseudograminearum]